jgi:hypothetical protein
MVTQRSLLELVPAVAVIPTSSPGASRVSSYFFGTELYRPSWMMIHEGVESTPRLHDFGTSAQSVNLNDQGKLYTLSQHGAGTAFVSGPSSSPEIQNSLRGGG